MMIRLFLPLFLMCWFVSSTPEPAQAGRRVAAANLTDNFVGVSEGFDGAKLTVFGVLKSKADAVVVIEGPAVQAKVRKKARQFGLWINGSPEIIGPVPSFYAVVASNPIEKVTNKKNAATYGLDIDDLDFAKTEAGAGYVETKKKEGLYQYHPDDIDILESNLFRADIVLPASVPIGEFRAHIYEFSGGQLSAVRVETFNVAQVGMNARLNRLAHEQPLLYAFIALALALSIGGGAASISRRLS